MFAQSVNFLTASSNQRQDEAVEMGNSRFLTILPRVVQNVSRLAIPIIALSAMSSISGADAGPMAYGVCTAWCFALASPVFLPACIIACIPAGVAPTV